uniref:Cyclin dependent kinase 2 associated protein 2 n=1 Tax=Malurus cyaneus samueli TaxID=2593467 RepID=A0A8C5TLQ5_9PASS
DRDPLLRSVPGFPRAERGRAELKRGGGHGDTTGGASAGAARRPRAGLQGSGSGGRPSGCPTSPSLPLPLPRSRQRQPPPPGPGAPSAATSVPSPSGSVPGAAAPFRPLFNDFGPPSMGYVQAMKPPGAQGSQSTYTDLLSVIEEMGKEIRPTYAGSKSAMERLKRGIIHARALVRECLAETERNART